jgi:hypothetical protein
VWNLWSIIELASTSFETPPLDPSTEVVGFRTAHGDHCTRPARRRQATRAQAKHGYDVLYKRNESRNETIRISVGALADTVDGVRRQVACLDLSEESRFC